MDSNNGKAANYREGSLSLPGAVAMGTGVMIGAGIFALTGQIAELAGNWFPLAFLLAAVVCGFSAYSYVKMANAYPSAGGIAMFLKKAYSRSTITGASALLMFFSMIINQSLVARTFATYSLEPFGGAPAWWWIPALGVALLLFAFTVNILGNKLIEGFSFFTAFLKIAGLVVLAGGGLWASGADFESLATRPPDTGVVSFLGAIALGVLAYKGFTTITNSGGEIKDPHRNVGRAIIFSLAICTVLYLLVSAIVLDVAVLGAFLWVKWGSDRLVIWASAIGLVIVFAGERWFLRRIAKHPDSALIAGDL